MGRPAFLILTLLLGGCAALNRRLALDYEDVTVRFIFVKDAKERDAICWSFIREKDFRRGDGRKLSDTELLGGLFVSPRNGQFPTIIIAPDDPNGITHEVGHLMDYLYKQKLEAIK